MVAVLRRPSECAWRMTSSQVATEHLRGEMAAPNFVVENLGRAAGNRVEPRRHQAFEDGADGKILALGEVANFLG